MFAFKDSQYIYTCIMYITDIVSYLDILKNYLVVVSSVLSHSQAKASLQDFPFSSQFLYFCFFLPKNEIHVKTNNTNNVL